MNDKRQDKKTKRFRIMRILFRLVVVLIVILFTLIILLNIPAVQTFVVTKISESISEKSGAEFRVGSVKVAFPKTLAVNDIYIQDQQTDTLLYLKGLRLDVDLFRLFRKEVFVNHLQLENLIAHIHTIDDGDSYNFQFIIDSFFSDTTDKTPLQEPTWIFNIKDIHLKNIDVTFADARVGIETKIYMGDFKTKIKDFDLNKQLLNFSEISLDNTSIQLILAQLDSAKKIPALSSNMIAAINSSSNSLETTNHFTDWNIYANQLTLNNINLQFDNNSFPKLPVGIDYQHLLIKNLSTGIHNISIDPDGYKAEIKHMSFTESCGLDLKRFSADAQFTGRLMEVKDLQIETSASNISADASLVYEHFNYFLNDLGNCTGMLDLKNAVVNANELFLFAPVLSTNTYASKLKNSEVFISAKANGKVNDLNLKNLEISFLKKTSLTTHARLTGLPYVDKIKFDASLDLFTTSLNDLYQFIDPVDLTGLNLPESVDIKGTIKGKTNSLEAKLGLTSTHGNITLDAFYQNHSPAQPDTFRVDFTAEHILAGVILTDSLLKEVSFMGEASGSGISVGSLSGTASLIIREAMYNSYIYKNIQINSQIVDDLLSLSATSDDSNLNFDLSANADLRESTQYYSARLDLSTLNLHALNFTEDSTVLTTRLEAVLDYAGFNNSELSLEMKNTLIQVNQETHSC